MLKTFSNKGEANEIPLNAKNLNFNFTELINILHPVGEYFYTSDANFNPNTAWCGTWVSENDGTVLASKSDVTDSVFNAAVGTVVGEERHTLTIAEIPSHAHGEFFPSKYGYEYPLLTKNGSGSSKNGIMPLLETSEITDFQTMTGTTGEDKSHNNVQSSKICFRWHRTA